MAKHYRKSSSGKARKDFLEGKTQCEWIDPITEARCTHVFNLNDKKDVREIDHIESLESGGKDEPSNWQVLCNTHHKIKTAMDMKKIVKVRRLSNKEQGFIRPKQSIQSAGFSKTIKPQKLTKSPLPPRALYKDTSQ